MERRWTTIRKRALSLLLVLAMVLGMMPSLAPRAEAASNMDGGFEGQEADVFSALGFDTTVMPEGYDETTVDNPYGRNVIPGNQVFEALVSGNHGMAITGVDNNSFGVTNVVEATLSGDGVPLTMFAVAAADLDGDGLAGEAVYVGYEAISYKADQPSDLYLMVYDAKTGHFSQGKRLGAVTPGDVSEEVYPDDAGAIARFDYSWQNLLQIAAGDFDGDGTQEIAVYVAESGNSRVEIYKYMKNSQSPENGWMQISDWVRVWNHPVSNATKGVPNMVGLLAADVNRDGVDDLGITTGRVEPRNWALVKYNHGISSRWTFREIAVEKSTATMLWGSRTAMLQASDPVDLNEDELGELSRVSLHFGDVNGDGENVLFATGQPCSDLIQYFSSTELRNSIGNTSRSIITYVYDTAGLVVDYSGNHKVVDGEYQQIVDENGDTHTGWVSANGFGALYASLPLMLTNATVYQPDGFDYSYVYLDSCLYECTEGQLSLKGSLAERNYGGENLLDGTWFSTNEMYTEFGAVSADFNGGGHDQFYASAYTMFDSFSGMLSNGNGHATAVVGLRGQSDGTMFSALNTSGKANSDHLQPIVIVPVDVDMDTTLIEYTGLHYLTYSDPKVLAIIAAAPYFEDVDKVSGYDYAWQNSTSFSRISGEGHGDLVAVDLEVGAYLAGNTLSGYVKYEIETSVNYTLEWERSTTTTTEYTLTFETSQDEDAVVFFSIPTENYVYDIYTPDGNGGYTKTRDIISNTFQPVYQILNLEYYESIRKDYADLPAISGVALSSTPGDPGSYPRSTAGYDVIAQWNDDPAGVSFGNGAISQEITITKEEEESYNMGTALDFKMGGGIDFMEMMNVNGTEATGGMQFSLNPTGGWSDIKLSGTSFSGTVTNMPLEFRDYGYYYNWRLFAYNYTFGDGDSIPVVSYVVGDVTEPPLLPEDFQQDYDRTTSGTNVLTWSYSDNFSKFILYRYFDFPVGGGLQKIAEIPAGTANYVMKTDETGKRYKEYYFEDPNLAAYTEYQYAIQVERLDKTPPLSSPSDLLTARTRAAVGNPVTWITESDGENNGAMLVYPDKNSYLTAEVTGPEGELKDNYYTTVQYQWQKLERGAWVDLVNETNMTLTLAAAGADSAGEYRCRVNVLTKADNTAITAYTTSVVLAHSKRTSILEEAYVQELANGVVLYAKVGNAHTDSSTIPSGRVTFNLVHNATGNNYQFGGELGADGVYTCALSDTLPAGMYTVEVIYSGSFIFKPSTTETLYLSQTDRGYHIDIPEQQIYGDKVTVTFQQAEQVNGITQVQAMDADSMLIYETTVSTMILPEDQEAEPAAVRIGDSLRENTWYASGDSNGLERYFYSGVNGTFQGFYREYVLIQTSGYPNNLTKGTEPGVYDLVMEPGMYLLKMTRHNQSAYAPFTVSRREIVFQLPHEKMAESQTATAPVISMADLPIVSGSWPESYLNSDGTLKNDIRIELNYTSTAGTVYSRAQVAKMSGYYTTNFKKYFDAIDEFNDLLFDFRFVDGSMTVTGGNMPLEVGVRAFEGQEVGTLYMLQPDYAQTRSGVGTANAISQQYSIGNRLVFNAVPDEGYEIYDWYVNGVAQNTKSSTFAHVMLYEETTIEVQFSIKQNTLSFGVLGAEQGGTLECSDPDLTSGSVVLANALFTFTAKAREGYHFKEWRYTETGKGTVYDDTDSGKMESTFELLMPASSCSVYAVFERDLYTFTYTNGHGGEGLTAWYMGSSTSDNTAEMEKITIASGDKVPGDTTIVVEAAPGYALDPEYNFVAIGSQGTADYDAGTYTLVLKENTSVSGYALRDSFDLTLAFDVTTQKVAPGGAQIRYYIDNEEHLFAYDPTGDTEMTITDIPGGSAIRVEVEYPAYYTFHGLQVEGSEEMAPVYDISALSGDTRLTAKLEEKSVYTIGLADIAGKGTYSYELPEGASEKSRVITAHQGDQVTILVTPAQKWTVSYWEVRDRVTQESSKVRATSLKYQFPELMSSYFFTPVFSGTTYNTISWNEISQDKCQVTLVPEEGYLSSVAAGGDFKFRLTGAGRFFLDQVIANGLPFEDAATVDESYPNVYTDNIGLRIYTIRNITANQVISLKQHAVGIRVNGVDISRGSGNGWSFDMESQRLSLTASGLTVSGSIESAQNWLSRFSIRLEENVVALTLSDLEVTSTADKLLEILADSVHITVSGDNTLQTDWYMTKLLTTEHDLVLRGYGKLALTTTAPTDGALVPMTVGGTLSVTEDVHLRVWGSETKLTLSANALHIGKLNSIDRPVVEIGTDNATDATAASVGQVTLMSGELILTGWNYALATDELDAQGGTLDMTSKSRMAGNTTNTNVITKRSNNITRPVWKISYPNGYLLRKYDNGTKLETTFAEDYNRDDHQLLSGTGVATPTFSYCRFSPVTSGETGGVTMTVTVDNRDYSIVLGNFSGDGSSTYYYYVDLNSRGIYVISSKELAERHPTTAPNWAVVATGQPGSAIATLSHYALTATPNDAGTLDLSLNYSTETGYCKFRDLLLYSYCHLSFVFFCSINIISQVGKGECFGAPPF